MKQSIRNIAVEGKHIVKDFRLGTTTIKVLKDVSLQVMQGEFVSIMGPSGSGKSTLLYILGGLDTPTSGRVLLDGTDISFLGDEKMSRIRRQKIGFVFQFYNLIPNLSVEENIMLPLLLDGKKMGSCKGRLEQILRVTGLSDRRSHTPRELSGGQQQRVAIARALIGNPEILFADEPTGNLDSRTSADVLGLLQRTSREFNQTLVMITHNDAIAQLADRIVRIEDGKIVG